MEKQYKEEFLKKKILTYFELVDEDFVNTRVYPPFEFYSLLGNRLSYINWDKANEKIYQIWVELDAPVTCYSWHSLDDLLNSGWISLIRFDIFENKNNYYGGIDDLHEVEPRHVLNSWHSIIEKE